MNFYSLIIFLFILSLPTSCSESSEKSLIKVSVEHGADNTETIIANHTDLPTNVDETFEIFLSHFNRDSLFQITCVDFPLVYKEVDMDSEDLSMIEGKIEKSDYLKMDFTYDRSMAERTLDAYTQDINVKNNKATIIVRGVDNGIATDYFFEKRNGKWMLFYFEDHST